MDGWIDRYHVLQGIHKSTVPGFLFTGPNVSKEVLHMATATSRL